MSNIKISALPAATFVNDGDSIPIVQTGVTKKVTPLLLLENLWTETASINGLIDDINATLSALTLDSIYTTSGNVFDGGTATTRNFLFKTDLDGTWNSLAQKHELRFNGYYTDVGGYTTQAGTFGMKASATGSNKLVALNMFGTSTPSIEMISVDTVEANTRKVRLNSDGLSISTEFASGSFLLSFTNNGATMTDSRPSVFGLEYTADYSAALATHNRSIPDVGTVNLLKQQANTWTTGGRPTVVAGQWGLNTTTSKFEGYTGAAWVDFH